jgi:hypothetical protein
MIEALDELRERQKQHKEGSLGTRGGEEERKEERAREEEDSEDPEVDLENSENSEGRKEGFQEEEEGDPGARGDSEKPRGISESPENGPSRAGSLKSGEDNQESPRLPVRASSAEVMSPRRLARNSIRNSGVGPSSGPEAKHSPSSPGDSRRSSNEGGGSEPKLRSSTEGQPETPFLFAAGDAGVGAPAGVGSPGVLSDSFPISPSVSVTSSSGTIKHVEIPKPEENSEISKLRFHSEGISETPKTGGSYYGEVFEMEERGGGKRDGDGRGTPDEMASSASAEEERERKGHKERKEPDSTDLSPRVPTFSPSSSPPSSPVLSCSPPSRDALLSPSSPGKALRLHVSPSRIGNTPPQTSTGVKISKSSGIFSSAPVYERVRASSSAGALGISRHNTHSASPSSVSPPRGSDIMKNRAGMVGSAPTAIGVLGKESPTNDTNGTIGGSGDTKGTNATGAGGSGGGSEGRARLAMLMEKRKELGLAVPKLTPVRFFFWRGRETGRRGGWRDGGRRREEGDEGRWREMEGDGSDGEE